MNISNTFIYPSLAAPNNSNSDTHKVVYSPELKLSLYLAIYYFSFKSQEIIDPSFDEENT